MSNNFVELGDYVKILSGYAFKSKLFNEDGIGMPLIRIRDVTSGELKTFYSGDYQDHFVINIGDLLITMDGEFKIKKWEGEKGLLNQRVCKIESASELLETEYLLYLLPVILKKIEDRTSFVTVKHLSVKEIQKSMINLPSLQEQRKVIEILNETNLVIKKRQSQITALDELTQSLFLEMFGDPRLNEKQWNKQNLTQIVIDDKYSIKRGPFGGALKKEIFVKSGYLVYEQYHAINDDFSVNRYFITEDKYRELEAFKVVSGDLIVSCSGVTLGRIAEIPIGASEGIINQALLKIALNTNIMNREFFKFVFRSESIQNILFSVSRGSGVPNLPPMSVIKNILFICPPIELQNDFEKKLLAINKDKENMKKSLLEMENLYNSLLQKAFKGELFQEQ